MTADKASYFLDTNLLVRANVKTAPFHEETRHLLERLHTKDASLWISRQVIREYLSVVTRPQTFMSPMSGKQAVDRVKQFITIFRVADENASTTKFLLQLMEAIAIGGKQVHDANIVATMRAYSLTNLLTYNPSDFNRFADFITVIDPQSMFTVDNETDDSDA